MSTILFYSIAFIAIYIRFVHLKCRYVISSPLTNFCLGDIIQAIKYKPMIKKSSIVFCVQRAVGWWKAVAGLCEWAYEGGRKAQASNGRREATRKNAGVCSTLWVGKWFANLGGTAGRIFTCPKEI